MEDAFSGGLCRVSVGWFHRSGSFVKLEKVGFSLVYQVLVSEESALSAMRMLREAAAAIMVELRLRSPLQFLESGLLCASGR